MLDAGMYEPLYVSFDAYPRVIPRVRVRGIMALFLAVSILWALIWLLYRAWQVCQTPNDVLVEKLGLDIPPSPEVTLEEVTAREIHIAWKQPNFHNSIHKNIIQVNGVKVGESRRAETAVEVLNLAPGTIYHICVLSVSAANFQTPSAILHVRTKSLPSSQVQQSATVGGPTVRATIPKSTAGLPSPSAPLMSREHSGSQLQPKRAPTGRKQSPAASGADVSHCQRNDVQKSSVSDDNDETVEQLAEKLKSLQHESETVDKQVVDEEEEHIASLKELERQRDELKRRVKEKDEASVDLKKQVYRLETVNRSVHSEKTKRERSLQRKETERKKRRNDVARWLDQVDRITKDVAQVREEKSRVEEEGRRREAEIKEKITEEQTQLKSVDGEIQDKGGRIRKLEEERKKLQGGDNEDGNELDRIDNERARQWDTKLGNLQARYASLVNLHAQAQQQYHEAQDHLRRLVSQQSATSGPFSLPAPDLDPSSTTALRSRRHRSSLASNVSSPINFPGVDTSFSSAVNYNPTSTGSPTFAPNPAFFNVNNGMTVPSLSDPPETFRRDLDLSSNNPQMSPRADLLLPSDLLGDEESSEPPGPVSRARLPKIEPLNAAIESFLQGPTSPKSPPSRTVSVFASPHEKKDLDEDADSRSAHLATAEDAPKSASRRLSGLFGLNRPRGKTLADEPPSLGTLKSGQSQSFPKNLDDMEPIGSRRRRLSYTGNWGHPISLLPRSNTGSATTDSSSEHLYSRRAAFSSIFSSDKLGLGSVSGLKASENLDMSAGYNQFSPRHDPIDPSSILGAVRQGSLSPRPSSTSFDKQLPHPSTDNQHFGWPSMERTGHRSPLGFEWTSPSTWSRTPSRKPSGSAGHLPLGLTGEPDYVENPSERPHRPLQAPIGTRPSSSHRPVTPKLNPAAPSFRGGFGRNPDKEKEKEEEKDGEQERPSDFHLDGNSPPGSRASKESPSLNGDSESLEQASSGTSMDNTQSKGSFIRKLTGRGSSGKFGSWKDRSGLFSKKSDSVDGWDDGGSDTQLGKSLDSTSSDTPSLDKSAKSSLGFFGRKSKKSDKTISENSERASEAGDEESPEEVIS